LSFICALVDDDLALAILIGNLQVVPVITPSQWA
jgi:hypothetical protein